MVIYAIISGAINLITNIVLAFLVILKNPKAKTNRTLFLYTFSAAFWSFGYVIWHLSNSEQQALFWVRILMAGAIFVPIFYFHFIIAFLDKVKKWKYLLYVGYSAAVIFFILNWTEFFIKGTYEVYSFPFWPQAGPVYIIYLLYFFGLAIMASILLYLNLKVARGIYKIQTKIVLWGFIIGYIGGATNFPLWYGIKIPPFGNLFVIAYVLTAAYAIVRYRFMDIKVVIRRSSIYIITVIVALAIYASLIALLQSVISESLQIESFTIAIISAAVIILGVPLIQKITKRTIEIIFTKEEYDPQKTLAEFEKKTAQINHSKEVIEETEKVLQKQFNLASINYVLKDQKTGNLESNLPNPELPDKMLLDYLKTNRESIIIQEELQYLKKDTTINALKDWMEKQEADALLILSSQDEISGLIILGDRKDNKAYSIQDVEFIKQLQVRVSIALANTLLYEKTIKSLGK